ncbi:MAG TPA: thymidine phosphorylase, partial [Balneola sp.]|nr:thymidine phosphorylase [Balneola sp.]
LHDVDPQAGIVLKKKVGDKITKGETILVAYTNKPTTIEPVTAQLYGAIKIEDTKPEKEYLVTKVIDKNGVRDFRL